MTTRSDFLAEILANPGDDAPRLVYSDWLTEQGDPYGEFIRLQIDREALPAGSSAAKHIRTRERKLQKEHGTSWAGGIPTLVDRYEFRRGFVGWVKLGMQRFIQDIDVLVREAPIEEVELRAGANRIRKLAECPQLSQFRSITLKKCRMKEASLREFANSSHLSQLRHLGLYRSNVTDGGCEALATSASLRNLRSLDLSLNRLGPAAAAVLADGLNQLQSLNLLDCWIRDEGASAIAEGNWPHLGSLNLNACRIESQGIEAIAASTRLNALRSLELEYNAGRSHFGGPEFPRLEHLNLSSQQLQDDDVMMLAASPHRSALRHLDISKNNSLTSQAIAYLAASPLLGQLKYLGVSYIGMTLDEVVALAESKQLKRRGILHLESTAMAIEDREGLRNRYGRSFGHFDF